MNKKKNFRMKKASTRVLKTMLLAKRLKPSKLHTYIVSLGNQRYCKVRAVYPGQARRLAMHIGQNPATSTPPPPAPGKKARLHYNTICSATLISESDALKLLKQGLARKA